MKIIIDIPEEMYKEYVLVKLARGNGKGIVSNLLTAIKKGKPLPKGHWKWELASNGWANHICSECGFKENTDIHVKLNWKFCPKCGAEMEMKE